MAALNELWDYKTGIYLQSSPSLTELFTAVRLLVRHHGEDQYDCLMVLDFQAEKPIYGEELKKRVEAQG